MDETDFEQLYWQLQPRLLGYAKGLLDDAAAYDAVAATFETLLRKKITLISDSDFQQAQALAFAILRGHVSHEYRSHKRRTSLRTRLALQPHPTHDRDIADEIASASVLNQWMASLSESDRHLIALFNAGHSTRELADLLGCTVAAAARRRDRAKKRLRTIIERDAQEVYDDDPTFA